MPSTPSAHLLWALEYVFNILFCSLYPHGITQDPDERELNRRGFLSYIAFGSLGIDWDTVSMSVSHLGAIKHVHVDTAAGEL